MFLRLRTLQKIDREIESEGKSKTMRKLASQDPVVQAGRMKNSQAKARKRATRKKLGLD